MAIVKSQDFEQLLAPIKDKALKIVDEKTFITECGFALQWINGNTALMDIMKADPLSIMQAVYNLALTGLSLNPVSKLAYLIPRKGKCVLDPSYQGLVKLLTDTGSIKNIYSHVVYQGDEFKVELGTDTKIVHNPQFKTKIIEKVYAVAILHDGSKQIEVMTIQEINDIKEISESYKAFKAGKTRSCIWVDNEPEMTRKTVIKRIAKYLPKTDRWEKFSQAVEIDNQDYLISDEQRYYLLDLLDRSNMENEVHKILEEKIKSELSLSEYASIKKQLIDGALDPITAGKNYGQKEIHDHLKKLQ